MTQDSTQTPKENHSELYAFIRMFAHELGNPVAAIRMSGEMLAGDPPNELHHQLATLIVEESEHLQQLIENALVYTSLSAQPASELNVVSILDPLMHRFSDNAKIALQTIGKVAYINGDSKQISKMLEEVLQNAIESGATSVVVQVSQEEGKAVIQIQDDGEGITQRSREQAFEAFYTSKEGKLGLGLSIARRIAELHDGTTEITPGDSKGTTITIRIPTNSL